MKSSVVAIPLLAAIWLVTPVASAQDPSPDPAPLLAAPRMALPRPSEPPARVAEPPALATVPDPVPATGADDQRGRTRGGDRGGDNRGRNNGRRPEPRVAVPRPPNVPAWQSSYQPRYYPPAYYDRWARRAYHWSPLPYLPWSLIYGSVGFTNYGYYSYGGYGPSSGYGYGPAPWAPWGRSTSYDTGAIRLRIRPRDAQVFVNGYYAGLVDDFDGNFQQLRLEQGGHKIEIRMPGFENLQLDVHVQPNRTITIREDLRPRP
jgi:hypothetical protein